MKIAESVDSLGYINEYCVSWGDQAKPCLEKAKPKTVGEENAIMFPIVEKQVFVSMTQKQSLWYRSIDL